MSTRLLLISSALFLTLALAAVSASTAGALTPTSVSSVPSVVNSSANAKDEIAACEKQVDELRARIVALEESLSWRDRMALRLKRMIPPGPAAMLWFIAGMVGEFVFFLRFVVQWLASERKKRTVVPMAFWHLSLIGTAMVLAYALHRMDPVFILAYSLNIFIYVRNMVIARRQPAAEAMMEKESE